MQKTRVYSLYAEACPLTALEVANPGLDSITYKGFTDKVEKRLERYVSMMDNELVQGLLPELTAITSTDMATVAKFIGLKSMAYKAGAVCSAVRLTYEMFDWKYPTTKVKMNVNTGVKLFAGYVEVGNADVFCVELANGDQVFFADANGEQSQVELYKAATYYTKGYLKQEPEEVNLVVPMFPINYRESMQKKFLPVQAEFASTKLRFSDVYSAISVNIGTSVASKRDFAKYRREVLRYENEFLFWVRREGLSKPYLVAAVYV